MALTNQLIFVMGVRYVSFVVGTDFLKIFLDCINYKIKIHLCLLSSSHYLPL